MVAGGGASVIYADTVADLGFAEELGNYAGGLWAGVGCSGYWDQGGVVGLRRGLTWCVCLAGSCK